MKAIVCNAFGPIENLQYTDIPAPSIGNNEVLIKVEACGVNFPDALLVQGKYQLKPECPFIPGTEVSGTIEATGQEVAFLKAGMRVIGLTMLGGYAEKVALPANQVIPLSDGITLEEAAGLVTAHATAHHALVQRANIQTGEILLVTGAAGGTGLAAVQIGKALGAIVIAACSTDEKLALARENGADHCINYSEVDLNSEIKRITHKRGADVVYECVGGKIFDACSRAMNWQGRLLVVGFASGEIPELPVNLALVKGYAVVGVFWGQFIQRQPELFQQNMKTLLKWYEQGKVRVRTDRIMPLADATNALKRIVGREVKGKLILKP